MSRRDDYLRARDALLRVREVPGGGEMTALLFALLDGKSSYTALRAATWEAEAMISQYENGGFDAE